MPEWAEMPSFAVMYISKAKKYRETEDGTVKGYPYYRLTKSYRDANGNPRTRSVLCLGELEGFSKEERDELADMLTVMIEKGQYVMHENQKLYEKSMELYSKYRESRYALENDPLLKAEAARKERERLRDAVTVRLDSLTQHCARTVGPENLCNSTLRMLKIREFLTMKGWTREQVDLALMQVISRAIYPYSELKTVRYLRDNSALPELFKIKKECITKDALYKSAVRLWEVHREMEDWLHERVRSIFDLEEDILLFDITNTYLEGRMQDSGLCQYGRSKEKRDDCKIVVLAAVVNTEGLLVRTMIYEGNRADSTTLKEVIGSLKDSTSPDVRKIVVMDAGFYTKKNVEWLETNDFRYITVLPSGSTRFKPSDKEIVRHEDCKHQEIRLQAGTVEIDGKENKALLVDSDAKVLKEKSMYEQACRRYEEGLEAIKAGIARKGGVKKRDAVNNRLGKLHKAYGAVRRDYTVTFKYEGTGNNEKAISMEWSHNAEREEKVRALHGKYVLLTNLEETDERNIWKFYNVIRTVEETFHVLKTDLDIRPVYHKSDTGIKAHLNLAVLGYWLVSVTKQRLKLKKYPNVRWDEIIRIASTQVVVTARMETADGHLLEVRQSTEAEDMLSTIYRLLDINPAPLGKIKSVVHLNSTQKKEPPDFQGKT